MNYSEASAVRSLTAEYLPTYNLGLQGYTVNIIANGTSYVLNYNPYGGFESADEGGAIALLHGLGVRPVFRPAGEVIHHQPKQGGDEGEFHAHNQHQGEAVVHPIKAEGLEHPLGTQGQPGKHA